MLLASTALPAVAGARGAAGGPMAVIVPFPAGGTTDTLVRALLRIATAGSGQAFLVENKPGASLLIAAQALARARPDGRTIGIVPMAINRLRALGRTTLDLARDFSFIARVAGQTHGLVVRADSALRSLDDVVRAARHDPGAVTYGTSGIASITHLAMEDFAQRASLRLRHIPFKGGTESLQALRGGVVDLAAESPLWRAAVDSGHCRLLATWNAQRLPVYPEVPTMTERGHPLVAEAMMGLGGPAGIDGATLARLRTLFGAAIRSEAFRAECERQLALVRYLDGEDFRAFAQASYAQERALLQRLKFTPD